MHELSIAQALIDVASEAAARDGAIRVITLTTRIGVLSGIVKEALSFCFELAAEGTLCERAALVIEEVSITVLCPECKAERTLPAEERFRPVCPVCGHIAPKILRGQELELVSIEIEPNDDPLMEMDCTSYATTNR